MPEFPYEKLFAVCIIWLGLAISAIAMTLFQYYKKSFVNDVVYRKHYHFWLSLAILWYFLGSAYLTSFSIELYGGANPYTDSSNLLFSLNYLLPFSIPFLTLLAVALIPAKLQNWLGKNVE
ncbi:hypothetical protein [Methyloglobulus sp.]|uniref:hypothetical protein n=1 Tax=Methyloglobulus sp. TaxID=2518622 RepID=UPI0032B7BDB6